jgi:hypothetical protein
VTKYCRRCLTCLIHKQPRLVSQVPLHSIPKGETPFETLHCDYFGSLKPSEKLKFVFVIIDAFLKYCLLIPNADTTSARFKENLTKTISLFGTPKRLITDNGSFVNPSAKQLLEEFRINLHLITPHVHRANEQVERYMSTIADMLRKECRNDPCTWSEKLWKFQLVLNTTKQKSTGCTLLQQLLGRERSIPTIAALLNDLAVKETPPNRKIMREMAAKSLAENAARQEK